jgi:meso-butanediol dehydrogenase/(S,S)-butanediol dehydrogenase/diacetyl reductase
VNNAGVLKFGKLDQIEPRAWKILLRTNAFAPWRFMVAVLPEMRKAGGGSIINISSINGIKAFPGAGLYCASKAAQQMLSQVMAMEVAEDNIRVNSILPGLVEDTEFLYQEIGKEELPQFFESLRLLHPLGRNTKPKDVADAALFLASDQSVFISGVLLNVDGGRHLATNRPPAA